MFQELDQFSILRWKFRGGFTQVRTKEQLVLIFRPSESGNFRQ
jgi:hypothetical protein